MASGPTITAKFVADTKNLSSGVDDVAGRTTSKLGSMAATGASLIGGMFAADAVIQFGKDVIDMASSVAESTSKIGVVFGNSAGDVMAWSKNSATALGLSQAAALEAVGTYGNLAVSLGIPTDQAADMSKNMVQLASDMASFNNVPIADALAAIQSGFTGETEPMRRFGVVLNAASVEAEALALGLKKPGVELDAASKAQATWSLMLKQSATAQGDFARTSDGLANQTKINAAKFDDMKAAIGDRLLPVMTSIASFIGETLLPGLEGLGKWMGDNPAVMTAVAIGIGAVGLAIMASLVPALASAAVAGAPFLLIGALIAGVAYLIVSNWDSIKAGLQAVWEWMEPAMTKLGEVFSAVWSGIQTAVSWVWDNVLQPFFGWLSEQWTIFQLGLEVMWAKVEPILSSLGTTIQGIWEQYISPALSAFGEAMSWLWQTVISPVVGFIIGYIEQMAAAYTWLWENAVQPALAFIGEGLSGLMDIVSDVVVWILDHWEPIAEILTGPIRMAWDIISTIFGWITDGFSGIYNFVVDTFNSIMDAVIGPVKAVWNALAGAWNSSVGQVSVTVPDYVPFIGGSTFDVPDLPYLAKGGVLTSPTLFVGGEAGTEIVAPEEMLRTIVHEESGGGGYTLNIYPRTADASDVAAGFERLELMSGWLS